MPWPLASPGMILIMQDNDDNNDNDDNDNNNYNNNNKNNNVVFIRCWIQN